MSRKDHRFWPWLLGSDPVADRVAADHRAPARGGVVISVSVLDEEIERVEALVERFGPVELGAPALA